MFCFMAWLRSFVAKNAPLDDIHQTFVNVLSVLLWCYKTCPFREHNETTTEPLLLVFIQAFHIVNPVYG